MVTRCEAQQHGDEMLCGRCGLTWEVGDADRPSCAPRIDRRVIHDRRITTAVRRLEQAQPYEPDVLAVVLHDTPADRDRAARELYTQIPVAQRRAAGLTVDGVAVVLQALRRA